MTYREDPPGYSITYTDDDRLRVVCILDGREVGVYDARDGAVDAAEDDAAVQR